MSRLSQFFSRSEFACRCGCGFAAVDSELLSVLMAVRLSFGVPVKITSACRCESHNRAVGGSAGSFHAKGMAADIVVSGVEPSEVERFLDVRFGDSLGVGVYSSFTHVDVRGYKSRWIGDY